MTIVNKLNAVLDSKENIKNAIEAKGVIVGSAPLSQYADKIGEIEVGVNIENGVIYRGLNNNDEEVVDVYFLSGNIKEYALYKNYENYFEVNLIYNVESADIFSFRKCYFTDESKLDTITEVGIRSFEYCKFNNLSFLKNLTEIPAGCFEYSVIESELIIPGNVKQVNGFRDTTTPKLELEYGIEEISVGAFMHAIKEPQELIIPDSISKIGFYAFGACNITKLTGSKNMINTTGEYEQFYNNKLLEQAHLPGGEVFARTFSGCESLKSVTLGSVGKPVKSMNSTFRDCTNLTQVEIYVSNLSSPPTGAPWGATNATITYLQA